MKQILFIDDDPVVVAIYRERMERAGFRVDVAEDGLAAMESLKQSKPDLVVLDLMLPKANGVEVLRWIRGDELLRPVPVIVLSNAYLSDMVTRAMLAGANKALAKSQSTPAKLLGVIREFLGDGDTARAAGGEGAPCPLPLNARPTAAEEESAEGEVLAKARAAFLSQARVEVARIRELCLLYVKTATTPSGRLNLHKLFQRVHFISTRAGLTGCARVDLLASAFEALLFELAAKQTPATTSVLQTITQATDCLGRLLDNAAHEPRSASVQAKVLVVDDDEVCNYFVVTTLRRMGLEVDGAKDPQKALQMLWAGRYDLILLDINMPGMDGFDVCKRLRQLPHYPKTPVVFITVDGKFENRVQSVLSGGNEFITKPVVPLELALKTMTLLLDARLKQPDNGSAAAPQAVDTPDGLLQPVVVRPEHDAPAQPPAAAPADSTPRTASPSAETLPANRVRQPADSDPARQPLAARFAPELPLAPVGTAQTPAESPEGRQASHPVALAPLPASAPAAPPALQAHPSEERQDDPALATAPAAAVGARPAEAQALRERLTQVLAECESLRQEVAALTSQSQRAKADCDELRQAEADWRSARAALEQQAQAQAAELTRLHDALRAEQTAREQLEQARAQWTAARTRLEAQVQDHATQAQRWEADKRAFEELLQTETTARERLAAELAEAVQQRDQAHAKLAEVETLRAGLAEQEARATQEAARRAAAEQQISDLTTRLGALEEELAQRAQAEADWRSARAALEQQAQAQAAELTRLHDALRAEQTAREQLEQARAQWTAARTRLEAQVQDHATQAQRWEADKRAFEELLQTETTARERLAAELVEAVQQRDQARAKALEAAAELAAQGGRLAELSRELEAARQQHAETRRERDELRARLAQSQAQVVQEAGLRAVVEQQISELTARLGELEQELARRSRIEEELRRTLGDLTARRDGLEEELAHRARTETDLRRQLEEQAARLETEAQAQAAVRADLESRTRELQAVTAELDSTQGRLRETAQRQEELATRVADLERAKADLTGQLTAAAERAAAQQDALAVLETRLQERQEEVRRLEAAHAAAVAQHRETDRHARDLQARLDEATARLAEKVAAEESWKQRQAEWENELRTGQQRLATAAAELAARQAELRAAHEQIAALQERQATLCGEVQELTAARDALTRRVQEQEERLTASARTLEERQRQLATLRYAILEAARLNLAVSSERTQFMNQTVDRLRQITSTLLSLPLSPAQRSLTSVLQAALEDHIKNHSDAWTVSRLLVELPALQTAEFDLAEAVEGAFLGVRRLASQVGVEARTELAVPVPGRLNGHPGHLHQLITVLTPALVELTEAMRLELRVAVEPATVGPAELHLRFQISSGGSARGVCERLQAIAAAAETLATAQFGEAESGLAVCWQLTQALGGTPRCEATGEDEVRVQLSLPVEVLPAPLPAGDAGLGALESDNPLVAAGT